MTTLIRTKRNFVDHDLLFGSPCHPKTSNLRSDIRRRRGFGV